MKKLLKNGIISLCIFPLVTMAAGTTETMVQRRARIMRKYLQHRVEVDKGTSLMPTDKTAAEEDITNSEGYENKSHKFEKGDGFAAFPAQRCARPVRRRINLARDDSDEMNSLFSQKKKEKKSSGYDLETLKNKNISISKITGYSSDRRSGSDYSSGENDRRSRSSSLFGSSREDARDLSTKKGIYPSAKSSFFGKSSMTTSGYKSKSSFGTSFKSDPVKKYNFGTTDEDKNRSRFSTRTPSSFSSRSSSPSFSRKKSSGFSAKNYSSSYKSSSMSPTAKWSGHREKKKKEYKRMNPYAEWKKRNPTPMAADPFKRK